MSLKDLGADRTKDLIRLETLMEPLARYLGSPGDWGYETVLGDLTIKLKDALYQVRKKQQDAA